MAQWEAATSWELSPLFNPSYRGRSAVRLIRRSASRNRLLVLVQEQVVTGGTILTGGSGVNRGALLGHCTTAALIS